MLREFQEEIARLRAQLEAGGGASGEASGVDGAEATASLQQLQHGGAGLQGAAAAAGPELDPEEVARMRQQLEGELRAEYSSSGQAVDASALAQVGGEMDMYPVLHDTMLYISATLLACVV